MLTELFANNPSTTVGNGGTDAPAGGTSESWTVASSALFPAAATGVSQFHIADQAAPSELIAVTNVSGTTWTVTRGAESTTPVSHLSGFTVYQVTSAGFLTSPVFAGAVATAGLTGATAASRYVGATTSGAPASGTFLLGDFVIDQAGKIWICTSAGTPGTWTAAGPTIPVTIAQGGTGQTSASAALNALGGAAVAGDIGGTSVSPTVTSTHLASALPFAQGGTSAATQQAALDAIAGATTSGQVLRGNGTHVQLAAIQAADVPTLNQNTTGTAGGLSATLAVGSGGTGQATQQAAIDALAGAQTAGQFLRGNGTHVQMSAIQATDLPSVSTTFTFGSTGAVPSSGTYTAGQFAIDQNGVPRVCTASGTPGTWRRSYAQPYDFYIDDYGALGNATECLVTTVAGNHNITASTAVFTSTGVDGGKDIMTCGAGGAVPGGPDINTIATITDSTHAVLTNAIAAGGSGSGLACVFASSDRTAIDNCYAAAQTYAVAHGYFARVLWSDKKYSVGTGLFQSQAGVSGATLSYNAQIRLPVGTDLTGESGKLEIQSLGPTSGAQCRFWTAVSEDAPGAVIFSFSSGPNSADGTFGQQAIMQMPIGGTGIGNDAGFFNVKQVVRGLTFVQPGWSNSVGLDLYTACEHDISVTSSVFAPSTSEGGGVNPYIGWFNQSFWINNKIGTGVRLSKAQNNDQCESDICVQGLNIGVINEADHVIIKRLSIAAVDTAVKMNVGGNTQHNFVANVSAENYNNGLVVTGTTSRVQIDVIWDAEMTSNTIAGNDITDVGNQLFGRLKWSDFSRATGGLANIIIPTVSGGANLQILNDQLTRQVYDAHAYTYTLGTAFQNPWWGNVWVTIAGGTVSGITIGPTSAAATTTVPTAAYPGFRLPTGWWINIAGSGKPTTFFAVPD